MKMGFEGVNYQHTFWMLLILMHGLFITPSNSYEICLKSGDFVCHEENPNRFYQCTGYRQKVEMECSAGLHFDPTISVCNWPNAHDCRAQINQSKTTKLNDVGTATKPPTKSVVTTDGVPSKQSSLISKISSAVVTTDGVPSKQSSLISKISSAPTSTSSTPSQTTKISVPTGPCRPEHCKLPNCKCPGPEIPHSLPTNATPQIILLTFDDGIYDSNIGYYRKLFESNATNPNGCPIQATFFVSGFYTRYEHVKELYYQGHEIASHSKSHKLPIDFWLHANEYEYQDEIVGMKTWLSNYANISENDIRGWRSPFLAMGEDNQFKVLQDNAFYYDSSMVTGSLHTTTEVPIWPFTLDYPVNSTYCALTYCPKKSYPGLWEVPLIRWYNDQGRSCSMTDECSIPQNSEDVVDYLKDNFNRHHKSNKAPFGIFLHAPWLTNNLEPLKKFLEEVSLKNDVWIVTVSQALQWIQNPVPLDNISQFKSWSCK